MLQQSHSSGTLHHSSSQGNVMAQNHRNPFHSAVNMQPMYRPAVAPIQPYAFKATPSLNTPTSQQRHQLPPANVQRSPASNSPRGNEQLGRPRVSHHHSSSSHGIHASKRDSASSLTLANYHIPQTQSTNNIAPLPLPSRPQPDRYRRGSGSSSQASSSRPVVANASGANLYHHRNMSDTRITSVGHQRGLSADPQNSTPEAQMSAEDTKRSHRRSMQNLDCAEYQNMAPLPLSEFRRASDSNTTTKPASKENDKTLRLVVPVDQRARSGSFESTASNRSTPSSSNNSPDHSGTSTPRGTENEKPELNIPPRGSSSTDATKRTMTPSPLSGNITIANKSSKMESKEASATAPATATLTPTDKADNADKASNQVPAVAISSPAASTTIEDESPAAKKLAAIKEGGKSKTKTSRLRRAFSFGSVTEFRRAAAMSSQPPKEESIKPSEVDKPVPMVIPRPQTAVGTVRNKPSLDNVDEAEQERIARKQEASGLGNSIYGPRIFTGSTDNLSISSTASSASIMIRKMGRGVKRGGRSLVGLFRPKSMIGVPMDSQAGVAEISMVNAEAERQRTLPMTARVTSDRLRTPSLTSERAGSSGTDSSTPRKNSDSQSSGGPKSILKRRHGSPNQTATELDGPGLVLPEIPNISESPNSSAPSTPNDDAHKRVGTVAIGNEDYFVTALKLSQDGNGSTTPRQTMKRNATFSPRIIFHDTWPSQEYDRRGEISTCNRLTPLLAQQIKEELNSFKMEMVVHETSKIYTHFF